MEKELKLYRVTLKIKKAGFKAAKLTGAVITDDSRMLKKRVKERVDRLYEDFPWEVDIEVKEMKRIKSDFFFAL